MPISSLTTSLNPLFCSTVAKKFNPRIDYNVEKDRAIRLVTDFENAFEARFPNLDSR